MAGRSENTDLFHRSPCIYVLDVSMGKTPKDIKGKKQNKTGLDSCLL